MRAIESRCTYPTHPVKFYSSDVYCKRFFPVLTWLQSGLQTEDQLTSLHIEETDLPVGEGCDQVGRFTAHQVY